MATSRVGTTWLLGVLVGAMLGVGDRLGAADAQLETGIRQAREGEFAAAVVTLDAVAQRLQGQEGATEPLTRAWVYLGLAYLGLEQTARARSSLAEALRTDPDLELSPQDHPPRLVRLFDEVRQEAASPAPTARPAEDEPASGGGASTKLLLLGAGGAAAAGAAFALGAGGGGDGR